MESKERAVKYFKKLIQTDVGGQGYSRFYYYDLAIEALEKQIAKKPLNKRIEYYGYEGDCPICNADVYDDGSYCGVCGQKIDWEDWNG